MSPKVFIGSSSEGQKIAELIQAELSHDAEPVLWTQDVFQTPNTPIEDLMNASNVRCVAVLRVFYEMKGLFFHLAAIRFRICLRYLSVQFEKLHPSKTLPYPRFAPIPVCRFCTNSSRATRNDAAEID